MHLFDQRILGIGILFLLGGLVVVKRLTTGSIFDKPQGTFLVKLVNIFNLFFLLVVNPLAAILLITRRFAVIDPTGLNIETPWILLVVEILGMAILAVFFIYLAMIIPLIALEEKGLENAYGERFVIYRQKVKKIVPFVY